MRAIAKHSFLRGAKALARAMKHVDYLQFRAGIDRKKEQGKARLFFDARRELIPGSEVKQQIASQKAAGVLMNKIILSPGFNRTDFVKCTRDVMKQISRNKGQDLIWRAVLHTNTSHHHVHLIVLGKDKSGRNVRFGRQDYKQLRQLQEHHVEREHGIERYLDREMSDLLSSARYAVRGDSKFRELLQDGNRHVLDPSEQELDLFEHEWQPEGRPWTHQEWIRQSQGQLEPFHARYQSQMLKLYWQDVALSDPSMAAAANVQLEWLNAMQAEDKKWEPICDLDVLLGTNIDLPETDRTESKIEYAPKMERFIQFDFGRQLSDERERDDDER